MKLFGMSRCRLQFCLSLLLLLHFHRGVVCQEKEDAPAHKLRPTSYVIGEEAPKGRFPYICSLSRREDGIHRCGGFLIRPQWVVTAAHCVDPAFSGSIGRHPLVRCGIHDLDPNDLDKVSSGEESYWPDSWTGNEEDGYDIAVVKLETEANLTLPSIDKQAGEFRSGKLFTALGWGLDESGKNPDSLQMADSLVYVKHNYCTKYFGDAVKNHSICAGLMSENTCKGDSGGPLLIPNRFGGSIATGHPKFDMIVGVTSMGSENCSDGSPSIYTSIGAFWSWILKEIGEGPEVLDHSEEPSPSAEQFSEANEVADDELKEKLEQQKLEVWRKQFRELSQKKLIKEAYRCIKDDDALKLEAALLEGLDPDSFYESMVQMPWTSELDRLALLHWSAVHNASDCTEVLLDFNATVDKFNSDKETPLHLAAGKGHAKVVKILLDHGAKVNAVDGDGWTALHVAARYAGAEMVKILLDYGADVNAVDGDGWTALHYAARYAGAEMVKILLDYGADVNAVNDKHWTALHLAARNAGAEMVKILLDYGADVNAVNDKRWTALHYAARYAGAEMVKILLKHGADVDDETIYEQTPLHLAAYGGNPEVVKLLIAKEIFLNATDVNGETPLHCAAEYGRLKQQRFWWMPGPRRR